MKKEIERKGKDMTVSRYGGGDGQGHRRVQSGHGHTELTHVGRRGGEQGAVARRPKVQKGWVTKMSGL